MVLSSKISVRVNVTGRRCNRVSFSSSNRELCCQITMDISTIELKTEDPPRERVILEETFYVLNKKSLIFRVRLTKTGLSLIKECDTNVKEQTVPIRDIIGCRCLRSKKQSKSCACQSLSRSSLKVVDESSGEKDDKDISAYLYVYAYILHSSRGVPSRREKTIITLRFRSFDRYEDNYKEAQRWRTAIKQLIRGQNVTNISIQDFTLVSRPKEDRRLLVLLNPKSGPGKGRNIFQQKIAPILCQAEVSYDLHITKHANFAREFVRTNNIYQWNGIVTVSKLCLLIRSYVTYCVLFYG